MHRLLPLLIIPVLGACAPLPTLNTPPAVQMAPVATRVTTSITYNTGVPKPGEDNPVLAAVVSIAPTAPVAQGRQPWRAEEIESNSVVLRSNATAVNNTNFETFMATLPLEMSFGAIRSGNTTTLTATYSSAYAASAQDIFDKLGRRFSRIK
ncbi:hypothetical protein [Deinococcus arenicola]|uniref:Uncharacterized protein n=1 Tax=Deinococcus arenicola TaxID=2994950 RepID=A0ABU4DP07_9DEIO|nr:hypothetical protein [Deinococcus sp. ZS9-10]MDV6374166.1 hypothetical protein [Deinococcus sp. ZS9-10]